jgi:hypothetical protein
MSEIFIAKRSKHLCRRPPYMAYSFDLAAYMAGSKLILSNYISANREYKYIRIIQLNPLILFAKRRVMWMPHG